MAYVLSVTPLQFDPIVFLYSLSHITFFKVLDFWKLRVTNNHNLLLCFSEYSCKHWFSLVMVKFCLLLKLSIWWHHIFGSSPYEISSILCYLLEIYHYLGWVLVAGISEMAYRRWNVLHNLRSSLDTSQAPIKY